MTGSFVRIDKQSMEFVANVSISYDEEGRVFR